ncbi:uracil-DNA glycosylase, putative, partial [Bodo saltans]
IWHQFAMDVVHIAGLLDDLPHDIAPVERYDFRFFLCPLEKAGEHYCCSKPRCIAQHCQSVCRSDSMGGEGCEVFPRCNYIHAYSRLRVALSVAPALLGPGLEADGLMISLQAPRGGESKTATIEWQKVNRLIIAKYGHHLMHIINLLHKIADDPRATAIKDTVDAINTLHSFCTQVRGASTLVQCKAILRTQDQPKQQKHKDPCDVSDSVRVKVTVNLLTSDPSTEETIQAKMDHNLVSAVALALNELLRPSTGQPIICAAEFDERTAQLTLTLFAHREIEAPWKSSALRLLAAVRKRDHHYRFSWNVGTCEDIDVTVISACTNTDVTDSESGKVRQVFDALANVDPLSKCVFEPLPLDAPCTKVDLREAISDAVGVLNIIEVDGNKIDVDLLMEGIHLTNDAAKTDVLNAAVQIYTGDELYPKLNAVLRMRDDLTRENRFFGMKPYMAILLRGLQCAPQVKRSLPIYRGVNLTTFQHCQYVEGVSVVLNTITSCTVDEPSAVKFAVGNYAPQNPIYGKARPVTFVIESATCVDVHHMSQNEHEKEMILLPGTRLKVTKVTQEQVWFTQVC